MSLSFGALAHCAVADQGLALKRGGNPPKQRVLSAKRDSTTQPEPR